MNQNFTSEYSGSNKRLSNLSKSKVNMQLLEGFNWKVEKRHNKKGGITTVYICQYNGWGKEFTRTWSILDHVRMHVGVKPYVCKYWSKSYTQKGNMLKHMRRHTEPAAEWRRNYVWKFWDRAYTEKYNLKVSTFIYKMIIVNCVD